MKVLHISNNDSSSAGLCAYRLHTAMKLEGIDSRMLVFRKTHNNDTSVMEVFKYRKLNLQMYSCLISPIVFIGIFYICCHVLKIGVISVIIASVLSNFNGF